MGNSSRMYWMHALSPLHVGAGRGVGYIDLPIMREKVTNLPVVPGSAVKGVIADTYDAESIRNKSKSNESLAAKEAMAVHAFGVSGDEHSNSGSLVFTDARLVCLPVRSLLGTFAWCTSPLILRRLERDLAATGFEERLSAPSSLESNDSLHVPKGNQSALHGEDCRVYLEDLDLTAESCPTAAAWANELSDLIFGDDSSWKKTFVERFAVVPDDVFNFLSETGTEVSACVRIEDGKKTVAKGALWYEESLPAESILAGIVWCDRVFGKNRNGDASPTQEQLLDEYCLATKHLQVGGKATVGRGRVRCAFTSSTESEGDA